MTVSPSPQDWVLSSRLIPYVELTNGHADSIAEDNSSLTRYPLRPIDRNKSPGRLRPYKVSTGSDGTFGHTSVSVIGDELDVALQSPTNDLYGIIDEPERENGMEASPTGFLGPKIDKDPVVILQCVLSTTSQFRSLLSKMDERLLQPAGDTHQPAGDISERLQRLLEHVQESDRIREDQCREVMALVRDGAAVNWEGIDVIEVLESCSSSSRPTGLGIGVGATDEDIGWTGENRNHEAIEDGWVDVEDPPASPQEEAFGGPDLDPDRMLDNLPASDRRKNSAESSQSTPALPRLTAELVRVSSDVINSLSYLADTVHSTSSLATATSRQLRGIKAGIDSWRDREAQEDAARVGVDAWERTRLTAGLGGVSTRDALDKELEGFKRALEDAGTGVEALRQKYGLNQRWTEVLAV